jgi:hypothetical protein
MGEVRTLHLKEDSPRLDRGESAAMNDVVGCASEVVLAGAHLLQQSARQPRLPDPRHFGV